MEIKCVHIKNQRYYLVQQSDERNIKTGRLKQKWIQLTRVDEGKAALHAALAVFFTEKHPSKDMPALIEAFKKSHFPKLSCGVRREYDRMYAFIAKSFFEFDVVQVLPGDILDFLHQFDDAPTARGHYKARLSTFFSWCVIHNYIKNNPCKEIALPRMPKRKGKFSPAKFWAIHDALPPIGQCFMMLTFLTRQRPTEIRLLRELSVGPSHIKFSPTKTKKSSGEETEILITDAILVELERARKLARVKGMRGSSAFLIQTAGGTPFTKSGLYSMWARACVKAGCEGITTRDIRPFALKAMETAGYNLKEIQLSAAHTEQGQTESYLNQYRDRVSNAEIFPPKREKL